MRVLGPESHTELFLASGVPGETGVKKRRERVGEHKKTFPICCHYHKIRGPGQRQGTRRRCRGHTRPPASWFGEEKPSRGETYLYRKADGHLVGGLRGTGFPGGKEEPDPHGGAHVHLLHTRAEDQGDRGFRRNRGSAIHQFAAP